RYTEYLIRTCAIFVYQHSANLALILACWRKGIERRNAILSIVAISAREEPRTTSSGGSESFIELSGDRYSICLFHLVLVSPSESLCILIITAGNCRS
ncbi:hypothetical protein TSAR_007963, partial [Trichomalopsis sarcophagae]